MNNAPDFTKLAYDSFAFPGTKPAPAPADSVWQTYEQIPVSPVFTAADLPAAPVLDTMPGIAPFTRGPYTTMYVAKPWTIRQYAGFSTAENDLGGRFASAQTRNDPRGPPATETPPPVPQAHQAPPRSDSAACRGG